MNRFPARVSKSGSSKVIVIPVAIADEYKVGETIHVIVRKRGEKMRLERGQ